MDKLTILVKSNHAGLNLIILFVRDKEQIKSKKVKGEDEFI